MSSMIAEAFVRIRPDTDSFRRDLRTGVNRDVRQVERSLASSNREFARFGRGALVGTGALGGLGRAAAFASATFIGGAGLTYALRSTVAAAEEAQVVQSQLENALDKLGISFEKNSAAIETRTQALSQMSGIDDELVTQTFTNFVRRTEDVTKALRLNAIAVDVARGRNISLESAAALVTRASLGMAGALRRVGIAAREGASATELLELLQRKYAGSAERYGETAAGAQARFAVALENTQEIIGQAVLPSLTLLLNKATEWLNEQENQKRIQDFVNDSVDKGVTVTEALAHGYDRLRSAVNFVHDADPFGGRSIRDIAQFGRASIFTLEALTARMNDLADSQKRVADGFRDIEGARAAGSFLDTEPRQVPLPRLAGQQAFLGFPATDAQRRQEALARAASGSDAEIAAITSELGFDQKALAFAKARIATGKGNLRAFEDQVIRLQGEIRGALDRLTGIGEERVQAAKDARQKIKDAEERRRQLVQDMITDITAGVSLGVDVDPLTIAQVNKAIEERKQARIQSLLGVPERRSLETDIQEQRSDDEKKLIPFIQRELAAVNKRLALLRQIGASRVQILQQTLTQQQLRRRIRDIRNQDRKDEFSLTDFFREAAREQAMYGSNIGTGPLSGQQARGAVAKNALAGATIVQNFHGEMPNPAQALQQASQAARALR